MNIFRQLNQYLPDSTQKNLILITGARQTGKTTLVQQRYPHLTYFNLDAPENREFIQQVSSFHWGELIGNAIIDEAQKEPVVFEKVKFAYDAGNIQFSALLGSSQIVLLKKIRESLAGRIVLFELFPLMLSEIANPTQLRVPLLDNLLTHKNIDEVLQHQTMLLAPASAVKIRQVCDYVLQWGGMPKLLQIKNDLERQKWLKDYEYTYLERDLVDLARLDDLQPFRTLQKVAALRSGHLLNYSELARDTGVKVDTAKRYLQYLQLSYQVILLQPFYRNLTSVAIKTPKIYWLDMGILRSLTSQFGATLGNHFETFVVAEIIKWIKSTQRDCKYYFYRTRSGLEVDILLQTPHGIIGIEIKYRERIYTKDYSSLVTVAKELSHEWLGGIVIYTGDKLQKVDDSADIWIVPIERIFF